MHKPIIMVGGRSDTGKTASLMNLRNPEGVMYLNFEGKPPPFNSKFKEVTVTDPYTLQTVTNKLIETGTEKYHTLVVDSITACMALYSTKYIGKDCTNKMAAWGDYGSFYDKWGKQQLPLLQQQVIVLAHIADYEDKDTLDTYTQAVVQGKLKNIGLEADFGLVVNTVVMPVDKLKEFENPYLTITEEDEIEGFKYTIQTRRTKETSKTKIRSPIGMWERNETYINADVQIVLDKHSAFFKKP